jgi:hypothetical protein
VAIAKSHDLFQSENQRLKQEVAKLQEELKKAGGGE